VEVQFKLRTFLSIVSARLKRASVLRRAYAATSLPLV